MSKGLRVLQLAQKPQRRGAELFAHQLSRELRRWGHAVQTAYLYPHREANALSLEDMDCTLDGREDDPLETLPGVHPGLLRRLLNVIGEFGPEVVQVNGARTVKYGAFARRARRNGRWRLIYRNIGDPRDWVRGWQRTLFYRQAVMPAIDGVVGVSETTLAAVRDFYGLSIPMVAIPNGVDPSFSSKIESSEVRRSAETPAQAPVAVSVGSLAQEKRLDRLLGVMPGIVKKLPGSTLWIVGDGPLRAELERQAETLGVAERVRFLGVQIDVASYVNAADLLVLSSDTEGIPAVILEAGILGKPVVTTRVGGVPECVVDGETGVLVDPADEAGLAEAIRALLSDGGRRKEMGAKAERWVRDRFSMDRIAQQYLDFYEQVLAR